MVASYLSWTYGILLARRTRSCYLLFVLSLPVCHGLIHQVAHIVLCFVWQLRCRPSTSPGFRVICLSSCTISSSWSTAPGPNITPSPLNVTCALCIQNILIFLLWLKVSRECLSLIWLNLQSSFFLYVVFWAIFSTSIARKHLSSLYLLSLASTSGSIAHCWKTHCLR